MKLGPDGFITYDFSEKKKKIRQAFPALTANPLDVAGAGDSLIAIMANGLASDHKLMQTAAIACCMTSISVSKMGNIPIKNRELMQFIHTIF